MSSIFPIMPKKPKKISTSPCEDVEIFLLF